MASEHRHDSRSVAILEALTKAPETFDFFQALRRIECAFRDKPRIGEAKHPSEEAIRLSQEPSLAFAPSVISAVERTKSGMPRLVNQFFGLFGPHGPLPLHLTEYARDRLRNLGDATLARFADLFHHRMLSLYYRAAMNAEPTVSFDRPERDQFSLYVGAIFGFGLPSHFNRESSLPDEARLYYGGRFAEKTKNREGLEAILADCFSAPVQIEEFVGEWIDVPGENRWQLGRRNVQLGMGATLGSRAWICQGKFRIAIGPIAQDRFEALLPGSKDFEELAALVRSYVGDQFAWDVRLIADESRKPWRLGTARLGWTSALGKKRGNAGIIVKPRQVEGRTWQRSVA